MMTINASALAVVQVTTLKPGDLFSVSGGGGDFIAAVVENDERRYMSWLRLTGKNRFLLDNIGDGNFRTHAPKVLRLGLHWRDLQLRVDEARIRRISVVPDVGCLLVADQPQIIAKFWTPDDRDEEDAFGISLGDISREHASQGGYCCDKWQLIAAPKGLPPEIVAEFSPPVPVKVEPPRA
jgi:hypothetical protein